MCPHKLECNYGRLPITCCSNAVKNVMHKNDQGKVISKERKTFFLKLIIWRNALETRSSVNLIFKRRDNLNWILSHKPIWATSVAIWATLIFHIMVGIKLIKQTMTIPRVTIWLSGFRGLEKWPVDLGFTSPFFQAPPPPPWISQVKYYHLPPLWSVIKNVVLWTKVLYLNVDFALFKFNLWFPLKSSKIITWSVSL